MPLTGLETTVFRPWVQAARKVIPWALAHPFIARPAVWNSLLALWFLAAVGALILGVTATPFFLFLALVLGVLVAGGWGWVRLTKPSDAPLVYLTQLAPATPGASETALNHVDAVKRRLKAEPLGPHITVRVVPAALNQEQAKRLLDHTGARAVMFGEVRALAGVGTWKTELLLRWPGDDRPEIAHITPRLTVEMMKADRGKRAPARHEWQVQNQAPLETLVAEHCDADDVERIEATLLALVAAERAREGDSSTALDCLHGAHDRRDAMSTRTRASVELTRTALTDFVPTTAALQELERVGLADADHIDLWNFLVEMAYLGGIEGSVPIGEQIRYAERAVQTDPANATAHYNLAEGYMAVKRMDDALREYDAAAAHPAYRGYYYVHLGRGVIHYNAGRFREASEAYGLAVDLQPTAESHLFLADALRQCGDHDSARDHYLRALRLEPTLADAHRGYWSIRPPDTLTAVSTFDRGYGLISLAGRAVGRHGRVRLLTWWLRRHYRRHPEDTRIHFMLGAHALLLEDLDTAEERLQFAIDVFDGVDFEALNRLAIVHGRQGRFDEVHADLEAVRDLHSFERHGPPTTEELRRRATNFLLPFVEEPRLATGERGERLYEVFAEIFEPVVGPIPDMVRDYSPEG